MVLAAGTSSRAAGRPLRICSRTRFAACLRISPSSTSGPIPISRSSASIGCSKAKLRAAASFTIVTRGPLKRHAGRFWLKR